MTTPPLSAHASRIVVDETGPSFASPLRETVATCPSPPKTYAAVPTPPVVRTPSLSKKKRIRVSHVWDVLLLKAVMAVDGHRTQHGHLQAKYEDALELFLTSAPEGCFGRVTSPTWKTLSD